MSVVQTQYLNLMPRPLSGRQVPNLLKPLIGSAFLEGNGYPLGHTALRSAPHKPPAPQTKFIVIPASL